MFVAYDETRDAAHASLPSQTHSFQDGNAMKTTWQKLHSRGAWRRILVSDWIYLPRSHPVRWADAML